MNHNPDGRGFGQRLCDATEVPRLELRGFHHMKGKQRRQLGVAFCIYCTHRTTNDLEIQTEFRQLGYVSQRFGKAR
jgi:hypothetical protein